MDVGKSGSVAIWQLQGPWFNPELRFLMLVGGLAKVNYPGGCVCVHGALWWYIPNSHLSSQVQTFSSCFVQHLYNLHNQRVITSVINVISGCSGKICWMYLNSTVKHAKVWVFYFCIYKPISSPDISIYFSIFPRLSYHVLGKELV